MLWETNLCLSHPNKQKQEKQNCLEKKTHSKKNSLPLSIFTPPSLLFSPETEAGHAQVDFLF
jgi:hypothetical protein